MHGRGAPSRGREQAVRLRGEMHELFGRAMSQSRALFEEALRRIALLGDARAPGQRQR